MAEANPWLDGRIAVVTGASSGIGAATAEALGREGAHVVLAARRAPQLEAIAAGIRERGGQATVVPTDVSIASDVRRLFDQVRAIGSSSVLVCAAAVLHKASIEALTIDIWEETLRVNLTGVFLCCQSAFPIMRAAGGGRIVTIASLSGVYGTEKFPGLAAYNVSKFGVVGLTEALALEGRTHGIAAICLSPGAVDTEMLRLANPDLRPGLAPAGVASLIIGLLNGPMLDASGANLPLFSNA